MTNMSISYLLGLIEGDGCFYVNKNSFRFVIGLHERDRDLLLKVRGFLKMGLLGEYRNASGNVMVRFYITRNKDVLKLIKKIDASEGFHGYKGKQYEVWKKKFLLRGVRTGAEFGYWSIRPRWSDLIKENNILGFLEKRGYDG